MKITGTTVAKGALVLLSVILFISFISEGFVFNDSQKSIMKGMTGIVLVILPLYLDKKKKETATKKEGKIIWKKED